MRRWLALFAVALAAGSLGWLTGHWLSAEGPPGETAPARGGSVEGERRAAFELPDLNGDERHVSQWDGEVIVLNFWATWCKPCRDEMPMLDALQRDYGAKGLQVLGVALDEPAAARAFVEELGIGYPILVDDGRGIDLARRYGNDRGVLPFTVLIRRDGTVDRVLYGKVEREALEEPLARLL